MILVCLTILARTICPCCANACVPQQEKGRGRGKKKKILEKKIMEKKKKKKKQQEPKPYSENSLSLVVPEN